MGKHKIFNVAMALVFTLGLMPTVPALAEEDSGSDSGSTESSTGKAAYVEGEVLVSFDEAYSSNKVESLMSTESVEGFSTMAADEEVVSGDESSQTVVKVELEDGVSVEDAIDTFSEDPAVEYVQPNYLYYLPEDLAGMDETGSTTESASTTSESDSTTATSETSTQSSDNSTLTTTVDDPAASVSSSSATANQWWLYAINAFDAWDYQTCDNSVTIAILDTGIRFDHEDLADNILTDYAYDAVNETQLTESSTGDDWAHGTHVAGIAAGVANNSTGIAGVSYNANILPIKVFYQDYTGDIVASSADLVVAYDYLQGLMDSGDLTDLHVINMSLGGYGSPDSEDYALENRISTMNDEGVMTVCAAGNGETSAASYPSDFDECVSVVATTADNSHAYYSDYNSSKDIAAPGGDGYSTGGIYSTYNSSSSSYAKMSGTSMAAPVVSGCAALIFAYEPDISVEDATQILYDTATDLGDEGFDNYFGWGLVNIEAALQSMRNAVISADDTSLYVTQSLQLSAELYTNQDDDPATGTTWTWSVDDPSVATISTDGVLTGLSEGTVTVTVTADLDSTVTGTKTFTINPIEIPDGITATAASGSVDVTWGDTPAATSFNVYRATGNTDDANWTLVGTVTSDEISDSTYTFSDTDVESGVPYYYKVVPYGTLDGESYEGNVSDVAVAIYMDPVTVLSGSDRYGTLSKIVDLFNAEQSISDSQTSTVIVASGENYPDALSASGLAGVQSAPIVTVKSDEIPDSSEEILTSMDPTKVIVIGGTASISDDVVSQIETLLPDATVNRVYGSNRIKTSQKVYDEGKGSWGSTAIIACGTNFADALSVCSYAYASDSPIFLVDPDATQVISANTLQRIKAGGFDEVIIVGGEAAVPSYAEDQLSSIGVSYVRWSGSNRYETSEVIAQNAVSEGVLSADEIGIATGSNFADALAAGPLMGYLEGPLLLVDDSTNGLSATTSDGILSDYNGTTDYLLVFGGESAVSQTVWEAVATSLGLE
ncbi:MAG: S8 family serine peptidase [Coriobacteriales bacterium]|jgi:putative cell wall-binding protein/subtilisin family serine protease